MGVLDISSWSGARRFGFYCLFGLGWIGYLARVLGFTKGEPIEFTAILVYSVLIYLGFAFLGREGDSGNSDYDDRDHEIAKLQRQLSDAAYSLSRAQARGDHGTAAQFSAMVHEYESRLRRLGA